MILPRDLPKHDALRRLAQHHPDLSDDALLTYLEVFRAGERLRAEAERRLAAQGISHGRFMVLVVLNREASRESTPSRLAEDLGVTKATVTGLLSAMEADGLVVRTPCPDDRRACRVRLTDLAETRLREILPDHLAEVARATGDLAPDDLRSLRDLVARIG